MRVEPARPRCTTLATIRRTWGIMLGGVDCLETGIAGTRSTHILWAKRKRTCSDYATCTATYGSGVRTSMVKITTPCHRRKIRRALTAARFGLAEAAVGTTAQGAAGRRSATGPRLDSRPIGWVFALPAVRLVSRAIRALRFPETRRKLIPERTTSLPAPSDPLGLLKASNRAGRLGKCAPAIDSFLCRKQPALPGINSTIHTPDIYPSGFYLS